VDLGLKGKVALVTGGGTGIGAGICEALAQEGVSVAVNWVVGKEEVEKFAAGLASKYGTDCRAFYADVSRADDLDAMVKQIVGIYGRIDILVNNAGVWPTENILDMPDGNWERVIDINLNGPFMLCKRVARTMVEKGIRGSMINLSSKSGFLYNTAGHAHYATAKAGINMMVKTLQRELAPHGIRVNEEEMDILSEHDASIAICTESNLKLVNGFAPIKQYLNHNVRLCFGTDGVASNNNLDLLTELDFTAKVHKNINHDPTFLPAEQMLRMATIDAAKALYKDKELGSLEIGKRADLTILDCNSIEAQPLYNPYSQVIYALGGRAVRDVVINGELVLRDKKLTRLDEAELINTAKNYRTMILKELEQ